MEQDLNELIGKMERLKEEQNCLNKEIDEVLSEYKTLMAVEEQDDIEEEEKEEIWQPPFGDGILDEKDTGLKEIFKVAGLMVVSALLGYSIGSANSRAYREVVYEE